MRTCLLLLAGPGLATLLVSGCYTSSGAVLDARVSGPDASAQPPDAGAPPDAFSRPVRGCSDAPPLVLNGSEEVPVAHAVVPGVDTCWPDEETRVFRRLDIPARTGIEIRTEGTDAPVVHVHETCVLVEADRCVRYGESGFFDPGQRSRTMYFGNAEPVARTLYVSFWWVGDGETPFTVTTRTHAVAPQGACDQPEPLTSDTLHAPASLRGGTHESWHCWYLPESHFYEITIPPRHVALPLPGSQPLRAVGGCDCAPLASTDPLVHFGETPARVQLEADPTRPLGVTFAPIPSSATCESPSALVLDGVARPIDRFPRLFAGLGVCAYNDPHHYTVTVPAGRTVELAGSLNSPYPLVQLVRACDAPEACEALPFVRRDDASFAVHLDNDSDAPVTHHLVVGAEGPLEGPLEGSLTARVLD